MDIETIRTLRNGVRIPSIGFGTYKAPDDSTGIHAIREAINAGYRLIDTATLYGNEQALGKAVKESGIPREDLFLTTKVANSDRGYDSTLRAFDTSLQLLDTDYIDLYLIHWPASKVKSADWEQINSETWRALERLLEEKRVRAIGVSNFMPEHLEALTKTSHVMPMVNQIEFHPGWMQPETLAWCNAHNVIVEAWSPLGRTRLFDNTLLEKLSEKYDKS
ncbi:MAG: aldo/keto reductase, partial [Muribaculaceae bacterium]|nr:aldo/keto reductase [Muribaculaceae bacterium]